jgi:mannose-6-phosphate isomerase-like protein (cupin superfamily)
MSYPDPLYAGAGEVSASYRPDATPPDLGTAPGPTVEYLAPSGLTGGQFGLYRWSFSGQVSGPDAHFHQTISESFYILSGTIRLYDGDRWIDAQPGDFLHVPAGGIHAFKNESGKPASMLLHFAPGAPREEYFETLFAGTLPGMSEEERDAFFLRHDNVWL